jgi:hypothetical protein
VIVGIIVAVTDPFGPSTSSSTGVTDNEYPTSTTTVTEQTLSSQTQESATLGYAGSYTVSIPTGLPASTITQDRSTAEAAETAITEAKAALASAEATAKPSNASTLLAAQQTVANDKTNLVGAKAQLASDEQLGCPADSSATVGTASTGSSLSSASPSTSVSGATKANMSSAVIGSSTNSNDQADKSDVVLTSEVSLASTTSTGSASATATTTSSVPDATSGSVDQTTSTSTVLTGAVNPNGADTTYDFEYGTSPNYGETTSPVDAGSGMTDISITTSLTGLSPGATYYYRLVAANADGTTYGQASTFETSAVPTVTTGATTSISATSESVAGAVNPNGADTTYYFEYGPTASFGHKTPVDDAGAAQSAVSVAATVTGLTAGKSYDVALVATNALGTVVGSTQTFQAAESSCAVEQVVVTADAAALSEAKDALQVDEVGENSSVTSAEQALTADEATASEDEQALSTDEAQATNPGTTFTGLPAVGVVLRRGQSVYSLNNEPVPLFYGTVTPYRALSLGVTPGPDVQQLEQNLIALGFEHGVASDGFTSATEAAVEAWQASVGEPESGVVALGDDVVEPGPIDIASLTATAGSAVVSGTAVLTATSTTPVVTIDLDPSLQSDVKVGDPVTITLPNNSTTPGLISSVGTVATTPPSSGGSAASSSSSSPTITVLATLSNPKAASSLNQASVNVSITNASVKDVLAAPVDALLALASGGYALEEIGADGVHHLVAVTVGLFDDQAGLVQVSGSGLAAGQKIVVPNL